MVGHRAIQRTSGGALLGWAILLSIIPVRPANAGERYDLDGGREAALYGTGVLAGLGTWRLADHQKTLTDDDLVGRDRARRADRCSCRADRRRRGAGAVLGRGPSGPPRSGKSG